MRGIGRRYFLKWLQGLFLFLLSLKSIFVLSRCGVVRTVYDDLEAKSGGDYQFSLHETWGLLITSIGTYGVGDYTYRVNGEFLLESCDDVSIVLGDQVQWYIFGQPFSLKTRLTAQTAFKTKLTFTTILYSIVVNSKTFSF